MVFFLSLGAAHGASCLLRPGGVDQVDGLDGDAAEGRLDAARDESGRHAVWLLYRCSSGGALYLHTVTPKPSEWECCFQKPAGKFDLSKALGGRVNRALLFRRPRSSQNWPQSLPFYFPTQACVCVCVCVGVRSCSRVCVCVGSTLSQPALSISPAQSGGSGGSENVM